MYIFTNQWLNSDRGPFICSTHVSLYTSLSIPCQLQITQGSCVFHVCSLHELSSIQIVSSSSVESTCKNCVCLHKSNNSLRSEIVGYQQKSRTPARDGKYRWSYNIYMFYLWTTKQLRVMYKFMLHKYIDGKGYRHIAMQKVMRICHSNVSKLLSQVQCDQVANDAVAELLFTAK